MIKSDLAIASKKDDLLCRAKFSESLGKAILGWKNKEGLVVGIYGKWGSGKSSVINMAVEHIEKETKNKKNNPIIIRFNPWNFTEQNQLITIFFSELAKSINNDDPGKETKEIGEKLIAYSKLFSVVGLVPGFYPYTNVMEKILHKFGTAAKEYGELRTKNLEAYKEEVDKAIKNLDRKIIIIIDDVDRLTAKEIKQIFQLVKQNANFPNTTYLLSLDQEKAMKQIGEDDEYLEKIIQVNFHVPAVEEIRLEKILFAELDKVLAPFPEKLWDTDRWNTLYYESYKHLFTSVRRVNRYINSLEFNISVNSDEINPLDFFALEAIRVFEPTFYEAIPSNKELFVGRFFLDDDRDRQSRKDQFERLFQLVPEDKRTYMRKMIFQLFPQVEAVYRNQTERERDEWFEQKRVCSEKRFGNYFYLNLPEGEISQAEMNILVDSSGNTKALNQKLEQLYKEKRIRRCLERLPEFIEEIPLKNVETFVLAFYNKGDMISRDRNGDIDIGVDMQLIRLAYHLVKKFPEEERYQVTKSIMEKSESVNSPVYFLSLEKDESEKDGDEKLLSKVGVDNLTIVILDKIKEYADNGKLAVAPGLGYILFRWKRWGKEQEVKDYVAEMIKTPTGMAAFIRGLSAHSVGSARKKFRVGFKEMKDFTDIEVMKKYISKYTAKEKKKLTKDDLSYIEKFMEGIDDALEGKESFF